MRLRSAGVLFSFYLAALAVGNDQNASTAKKGHAPLEVTPACRNLVRNFAGFGAEEPNLEIPQSPSAVFESIRPVTLQEDEARRAVEAFVAFFKKVYGDNYKGERPRRNRDRLTNEIRTVLAIFNSVEGATIPAELLYAMQTRGEDKRKRVAKLKARIETLRTELGPSVEYLTPSTIAAMQIFQKIGASRIQNNGGLRFALAEVTTEVKENRDDLLRAFSRSVMQDQALRELLVMVADLVNHGELKPSESAVKQACHDLLVATFSMLDPSVSAKTLKTLEWYAGAGSWRQENPVPKDKRAKLKEAVENLRLAQAKYETVAESFVRGNTYAQIGYNIISGMTRPNAYTGIPLGHPFHDLNPNLDEHPDVLAAGLRAYGCAPEGKLYRFLSLSLGQMVDCKEGRSASSLYDEGGEEAAAPLLIGRFLNDGRIASLNRRGIEYRLQQAIELLETEKSARRLGYIAPIVSRITGNVVKRSALGTEGLSRLAGKDVMDYLLSQVETGGTLGPMTANQPKGGAGTANADAQDPEKQAAAAAARRALKREWQKLPASLPQYVVDDGRIEPWLASGRETRPSDPKKSPHYVFLEQAQYYLRTWPVQNPAPASPGEGSPAAEADDAAAPAEHGEPNATKVKPADMPVGRHLRSVLRKLDSRAYAILKFGDEKIRQEFAESGFITPEDIRLFANDVNELLDVFQYEVMAPFFECYKDNDGTFENAEETLAWYIVNYAPNLHMYIACGPPGPPNLNPLARPALAGFSFRLGITAMRIGYGNGMQDTGVFDESPSENPRRKLVWLKRGIAISLVGGAAALAGAYGADTFKAVIDRFLKPEPPAPPGITAPNEPAPVPDKQNE